jgi:hypothetical protein
MVIVADQESVHAINPGGPGVVSRKIVQALDIPVRKKIHAAVVDDRNGTGEARHPVRL